MPAARHTSIADAPVDSVWRRLADIESWPHWLHVPYASRSVQIVSRPPIGVGTEFILKGRLRFALFARITDWSVTRRLEFEIHRSEYPSDRLFFKRALIRIDLAALDAQRTRIHCTHRLEGKGRAGRLYAGIVMRPFIASNLRRIVDSLIAAT